MATDGELAGVIADNDRVTQKFVRVDAAPQRALGGDLDRVGSDVELGDAQPLQMRLPGRRISELFVGMPASRAMVVPASACSRM